jgi:hypothetical protein
MVALLPLPDWSAQLVSFEVPSNAGPDALSSQSERPVSCFGVHPASGPPSPVPPDELPSDELPPDELPPDELAPEELPPDDDVPESAPAGEGVTSSPTQPMNVAVSIEDAEKNAANAAIRPYMPPTLTRSGLG